MQRGLKFYPCLLWVKTNVSDFSTFSFSKRLWPKPNNTQFIWVLMGPLQSMCSGNIVDTFINRIYEI